jgi:ribosome biogenesis GTPase
LNSQAYTLADLGWSADFLRQLDADEIGQVTPARVTAVFRDRVETLSETGAATLALPPGITTGQIAVGDWVIVAAGTTQVLRLLDRRSRLVRRAAGDRSDEQLIVANVDTMMLVTSCNADFNEARTERFMSLAHAGGVVPVIVLTKADTCDAPEDYLDRARAIAPATPVVLLDARDPAAVTALGPWCGPGQTLALLGSSGVGKSTLAGVLTGRAIATQPVREDDAKGRHTTTHRQMHPIIGGGWLIDTPGMRELRLTDVAEGIDETFGEITDLAIQCRFTNCAHSAEPGCAVQAAIAAGDLDPGRLERWQKLRREDAHNSAGVAELRKRSRAFGKMQRRAIRAKTGGRDTT